MHLFTHDPGIARFSLPVPASAQSILWFLPGFQLLLWQQGSMILPVIW